MAAWFNKKTSRAMAEMAESLKAESLARAQAEEKLRVEIESKAAMERKVKAEAEKMLVSQFNKYSVQVERAEAKAKEAMVTAGAQAKEAEEKVQLYAAALAQAEEQLNRAKEQIKIEAIARTEAEEQLKVESEERKRAEAQFEGAMAAAKAKEEEKVHSDAVTLTHAQEKLIEAKGQVRAKAVAKAKNGPKTEIKERKRHFERPVKGVHSFKRIHGHIFHPVNIKRKFILLFVLVIFSALTFGLNVADDPSAAEPGGAMTQKQSPAPDMTNAAVLNYESEDNVTFKAEEGTSVPDTDTQLLTITAKPVSFKITTPASGKSNIVRFSDNNRLETSAGSYMYYEFSDVPIPANAVIKSAVLFVEHFKGEGFSEGKLEWSIGTGWPGKPVVWAVMKAPVHEGESSEAVDAWDITSVVNTAEKINSLQLRITNNNNVANGKTLVDYAYVIIEYH